MLCGWEGNRRLGGKYWQPTAGWMTYGHLRADCLYTGISSGPNARYRVWEAFLYLYSVIQCQSFLTLSFFHSMVMLYVCYRCGEIQLKNIAQCDSCE